MSSTGKIYIDHHGVQRRDHGQLGLGPALNPTRPEDQSIPGAFPGSGQHDQSSQVPSQQRDGQGYATPPTGVAAEQPGQGIGQAVSTDTVGGRHQVDERRIMDPADPRGGANVMEPGSVAGGVAGAGGVVHHDTSGRHNIPDERDHVTGQQSIVGHGHGHSTHDKHQGIEHGRHGHSSHHGTDQTGAGGVAYTDQKSQGREIGRAATEYEQNQRAHQGVGAVGAGAGAAGVGGLAHEAIPERQHHQTTAGLAGTGAGAATAGGLAHEAIPERQHHQTTSGVAAGGGIPASERSQQDPSLYKDRIATYSESGGVYNTVTGHGSGEDAAHRSAVPGHSQHGIVAGQGIGEDATHRSAVPSHSQHGTVAGHASGGDTSDRSALQGQSHHGTAPSTTGGLVSQATTTGRQPGPGLSGEGSHLSSANAASQVPSQSTTTGGVGPTATGAGAGAGVGLTSALAGAGTGAGGDHYGPGHEGSKVMHQCEKCGHDNDISHHFKKGVVYRVQQ